MHQVAEKFETAAYITPEDKQWIETSNLESISRLMSPKDLSSSELSASAMARLFSM